MFWFIVVELKLNPCMHGCIVDVELFSWQMLHACSQLCLSPRFHHVLETTGSLEHQIEALN